MASDVNYLSDKESRWVVVGICLTKVLAPMLRDTVGAELNQWYDLLKKPPIEIDKQSFKKHKKTMASSKILLQYKNINGNNKHKSSRSYDYAVRDALSLARLFVQPFMAKFAGFDDTMDLSALLTIMCEADPFVKSGAATHAGIVRSKVRNEWAHCTFSEWADPAFNDAIKHIQCLVKSINSSDAVKNEVCDKLEDWKKKVSDVFVDGSYLELVGKSVSELRQCVETWQFQADTKMDKAIGKLDLILSKLLCRTENNSKELKRHTDQLRYHESEIERLKKRKHHNEQKETFLQFAEKKVPFGLRSLPRDMLERPSQVSDILRLLTEGNRRVGVVRSPGSQSGDVVGIRGMGGLGKTVLALAVAWKASVSRQVIWLDIGEDPDRLELINILIKVLGGDVSFNDIRAAQSWIKEETSDKDCLVVLDDVWSVDDVAVFDHLSEKCQLLITTRDVNVVRGSRGVVYELHVMEQNESRALFYRSAGIEPKELSGFSPKMHQIIEELLTQCRGLPLALSLVGSNLYSTRSEQDWKDILDELTTDLEEIRSIFPADEYPHDNIIQAINVSFEHLEKFNQDKFLDFALFPKDTSIPSDILELFWSSEGAGRTSCCPRKARRILDALERKSMIQKEPELHEKTSYRVHDLLLDFARKKLKATGTLTDIQRLFVEILRGQCVNGEWNTTSTSNQKDYYLKYLPYHIYSSEQQSELLQLFFNLHWLQQKVKHTNMASVVSDFRFLSTPQGEIELLKSSLMLSTYVVEKNPDSICPQLLGRLLSYEEEYPRVKTLIDQLQETGTKSCHLLPLSSCLDLGGPEISRKIFDSGVFSLATRKSLTGAAVICGFGNGSIIIFDLETGKEVQQLLGHRCQVECLALSRNETILASGSWDATAILWNMDSYQQLFVLPVKSDVHALDFSVDDQRLFIGSGDGRLSSFVTTGLRELLATGSHELNSALIAYGSCVDSLCTTTDGLYVATAEWIEKSIKLWKTDTLDNVAILVGHTKGVTCVVATESGKDNPMLLSASMDHTIKIWHLKTYREIRTLEGHITGVKSVAVSDDKKHIVSGDLNGFVRLWCFDTGKIISCFEGHTDRISSVTILSDGWRAVSASCDKSVRVWRLASSYMEQARSSDYCADVTDITLSRDGRMCVSAFEDDTFKIWKCDTTEQCITVTGNEEKAISVAVSADNHYFVSLSLKKGIDFSFSIKVWNFHNGNGINEIGIRATAKIVRFSSDGVHVIVGCEDHRVFIWDWQKSDASLKNVILPSWPTIEIACDRSMIYTCSSSMHVCKINLGSLHVSTVRQGLPPPVISPDGKTVICGAMNEFICGDIIAGSKIKNSAGHPDHSIVTAIDITSNGKSILTGSSSGTLSLFDLEFSKVSQTFAKTESGVGIRFVCIFGDNFRFVFVDEANRIELRTFDYIEDKIQLDQPDVQVTCVTALGFSSILLGCDDGKLLWFCLKDKSQSKFHAHSNAISQVRSDLEDPIRRFVSGCIGGTVKLWNVEKNLQILMWSHENIYSDPIATLAFVPFSDDIIVGCGAKVEQMNAIGVVHTYSSGSDEKKMETIRVTPNSIIGAFSYKTRSNVNSVKMNVEVFRWRLNEEFFIKSFYSARETVLMVNNASSFVAIVGKNFIL